MDYAALAVIALLIAASAGWPLLRASGKRRKALKAQAMQLPDHHRPRYQKSLAWDPLSFPLAISSGCALCRDADTARSFWRAQPDSALGCAHDVHRTQVLTSLEGPFAQVDFNAPVPASQLLLLEAARELGLSLHADEEDRDWQRALVAAARSRT
ncbi:hypothetical protein [Glutamicibacter nicotianae]|uniref:DUF2726 domain-containing protein n=1 Tax=Glutamicibacter nicotianae TaxID=37929 RepID=A0ABQ0RMN2_GLUNI|nr:hypothetical protein [Glutamicibacter nicotianae]GEC13082.1 hypothetical protein ANI01nite_22850 [Glutamicibacter nicotianae]